MTLLPMTDDDYKHAAKTRKQRTRWKEVSLLRMERARVTLDIFELKEKP